MKRVLLLLVILLTTTAPAAPRATQAEVQPQVQTTPDALPVIFVPGISGSMLVDAQNTEYWPAAGALSHDGLTLYPSQSPPALHASYALTQARILGIHIPSYDSETYGPLFAFLGGHHFVEYQTGGDPARRTAAGCDLSQAGNHPNLFVFPYDWRRSNADNAMALADYVACVQKFYPNTQINLVAHSMGGLVARRYILDHPNAHHVNALVTVATPWLGAGKLVWVMETGQFVFFVWDSTLLSVIGSFTGAHELMNSQAWYDLGGAPAIVENGQDLNQNGIDKEKYNYAELIGYMDRFKGKEGFLPGTANQQFHAVNTPQGAQDNWANDTTGVKYFHIVGSGGVPDTINQVVATTFTKCIQNYSICNLSTWEYPKYALGDQTVPLLSSSRQNGALGDYNAPGAAVYTCQAAGANSDNVGHTGLLSNPVVQNVLLQYLAQANGAAPQTPPSPQVCGNAGSGSAASNTFQHMLLDGATDVQVTDGGPTGPARPFIRSVADYPMSETATQMILAGGDYTITFKTVTGTTSLEWTAGAGESISQAVRFRDVALPPSRTAIIRLRNGGFESFYYDADNNGTAEMLLPETVRLQGALASDLEAPVITSTSTISATGPITSVMDVSSGLSAAAQVTALVQLDVKDVGPAGLARLRYSLDGQHFQAYTGPFVVNPSQTPVVYAFADDNAGNRSALQTIRVQPYPAYLPALSLGGP